jgi:hypothetical protein
MTTKGGGKIVLNSLENCTLINYGHLNWSCYNVGKMQLIFYFFKETNGQNPLHKKPIKNNQIGGMAPPLNTIQ